MKSSRMILAAVICVLLLGPVIFVFVIGRKPFRNLDASDIAMATVLLSPPDITVEITDVEALTEILKKVVIYREDNTYTEYNGQGTIYTLAMTDGTQIRIMAYNPFLVIDGVGYRTKYEPCNALNSYANRLLEREDVHLILEEPPALSIISDNTSFVTLLGTYSWQRRNYDGTLTGIEVDSAHPLDCKDRLSQFKSPEATAVLRFAQEPDVILDICCWSDEHWSDLTADSEEVVWEGNEIVLKPGGYIYEVKARWNTENGYGGTASYSVYVYSTP